MITRLVFSAICSLFLAAPLGAQTALELRNGNFEAEPEAWRISEKAPMTQVSPDAAREGEKGLRVQDNDAEEGSSAVSARIAVQPGQRYRIRFWGRTSTPGAVGVYAWFYRKEGGTFIVQNPQPSAAVAQRGEGWHPYTFEAEAPADAGYLAVWVHSLGKGTGAADLDDFLVEAL